MPSELDVDEIQLARLSAKSTGRSRRKPQDAYVQMRTTDAMAGFHALRCPQAIVWHYIHYRVWADDTPTIPLPNQKLAAMGVSRQMKWRALQRLEQAGLIKVERRERRSPLVTLLGAQRDM
jgi:hypothetical protein